MTIFPTRTPNSSRHFARQFDFVRTVTSKHRNFGQTSFPANGISLEFRSDLFSNIYKSHPRAAQTPTYFQTVEFRSDLFSNVWNFPRGRFRGSFVRGGFGIIRGRRGKTMGLVKTRRLAAMHPPSPRLRRTGRQQRAKAGVKPPAKGDPRNARPRQFCVKKNILLATRDAGAALLTLRREV